MLWLGVVENLWITSAGDASLLIHQWHRWVEVHVRWCERGFFFSTTRPRSNIL